MKLNFENLTPEMAVELLDNKEMMLEFCSLVKELGKRVKELEAANTKLQKFAILQSQFNKSISTRKPANVTRRALPSTPRKKRVQPRESFGSFGWGSGKDSFGSF